MQLRKLSNAGGEGGGVGTAPHLFCGRLDGSHGC